MSTLQGKSFVSCRLQNQHLSVGHAAETPVRNLLHGLRLLLQEPSGLRSLWRGNWSNVLRVVPTYGARFWFFGYFDAVLKVQNESRRGVDRGFRWGLEAFWSHLKRFKGCPEALIGLLGCRAEALSSRWISRSWSSTAHSSTGGVMKQLVDTPWDMISSL